jgi:hypothetical protein
MIEIEIDRGKLCAAIALVILILLMIVMGPFLKKQDRYSVEYGDDRPLSLAEGARIAIPGRYQDEACGISFEYPRHWTQAKDHLPLPQEPLSQAVFDEPSADDGPLTSSIFSFICYDATRYSFDQFLGQSPFEREEMMTIDGVEWKRRGNFIYTVQDGKLLILHMAFARHDLKPRPGYEATFLGIVESVRF